MRDTITLRELVRESASRFGPHTAFQMRRGGSYRKWTFSEAAAAIDSLSASLNSLGLRPGDRIALLSENRPEWAMSYLAVAQMGAIVVPLDSLISAADHINLLKDSGARAIILSEKFMNDIKARKAEVPGLEFMISMDLGREHDRVLSFSELSDGRPGQKFDASASLDDVASILYTSGTTGVAKGVMLTHRNIMSNVIAVAEVFTMIGPGDNFLSVLPIHHTFETTAGLMCPFYKGAAITYAESLKSYALLANMRETSVTVMCGVPLLYRLFYDGIIREAEDKGFLVKFVFRALLFISTALRALFRVNIGRRLFAMVHKKLGGSIRFWVSGGAAISVDILKGFDAMGITILQGYGLTESSPILTCCSLEKNRLGSVGRAIANVELKIKDADIAGEGEVIARGPNIMKGYYKRPDLTAEVIADGWLFTGDIGRIDRDGFVYITGRSKDVIVTGSGLNVYPEEVEFELSRIPMVLEACVLGRRIKDGVRKGMEELVALVIPRPDYLQAHMMEIKSDSGFILKTLKGEVARMNRRMPEHRRVAEVKIWEKDFPKTSTKKIKRFALRVELGLA